MNKKNILVVGGGISGITTAIEIAEVGHNVSLVEKLAYLGGNVVKMNRYFPKLCPPTCGLEINFKRIKNNPRVKIFTSTIVSHVSGEKDNFTVKLTKSAEYVNKNCTVCGECEKVCPANRDNEYNFGLDKTKAIYLPHEMAFPWKYNIDDEYCINLQAENSLNTKQAGSLPHCEKCVEVCKYNAINLDAKLENIELTFHSIVFATGWQPYDASKITEYSFGKYQNVITNMYMERFAAENGINSGKILRPSNKKEPKTVAFVQCAGSRDENHLPYCSAVCCTASLKQSLYITEQYPNAKITIFYIDLRVSGRNEDFLNRVKNEKNVEFIKGKVGKITENKENNNLILESEDIMSGKKIKKEAEMVVLATGIVPSKINISNIKYDEIGFIDNFQLEAGIYATGCSTKPNDVASSLKDATGIALKAISR